MSSAVRSESRCFCNWGFFTRLLDSLTQILSQDEIIITATLSLGKTVHFQKLTTLYSKWQQCTLKMTTFLRSFCDYLLSQIDSGVTIWVSELVIFFKDSPPPLLTQGPQGYLHDVRIFFFPSPTGSSNITLLTTYFSFFLVLYFPRRQHYSK